MSLLNHTRSEWRALRARGHGHADEQQYLLPARFNHNWLTQTLQELLTSISEQAFLLPSGTQMTPEECDWSSGWLRRTLLPPTSQLTQRAEQLQPSFALTWACDPGRRSTGRVSHTFPWALEEAWQHGPTDSYLCCCTGHTELLITILLNKLGMLEARDTPRTSVHVGNIYLPLSFLQALTGARP